MTPEWVTFVPRDEGRGVLVAIEGGRDVPFAIKRVYTLQKLTADAVRGGHAHQVLRQVIVCLAGSCFIDLDDGEDTQVVSLDNLGKGLLLEPMVWHELRRFSPDCVLMVLASEHYDDADYIHDRVEFRQRAKAARA